MNWGAGLIKFFKNLDPTVLRKTRESPPHTSDDQGVGCS